MDATKCSHEDCQDNGHCILAALWFNPPEFSKPEPIQAAVSIQNEYWEKQREWEAYESSTVTTLWRLVRAAGEPT